MKFSERVNQVLNSSCHPAYPAHSVKYDYHNFSYRVSFTSGRDDVLIDESSAKDAYEQAGNIGLKLFLEGALFGVVEEE